MLSRFATSSFRAARPQPPALLQNANVNLLAKIPMSISSPKCQCQPQAKLPISIPSPECTTHEPLTPSPSCRPRAGLIQNCPTLGILRQLYLPGSDSHSSLPNSARNTSIELYLARSATHKPFRIAFLFVTPRLEVL